MNVQIDVCINVKLDEGNEEQRGKLRVPSGNFTSLLGKIACQPWVAMIVREWMKS